METPVAESTPEMEAPPQESQAEEVQAEETVTKKTRKTKEDKPAVKRAPRKRKETVSVDVVPCSTPEPVPTPPVSEQVSEEKETETVQEKPKPKKAPRKPKEVTKPSEEDHAAHESMAILQKYIQSREVHRREAKQQKYRQMISTAF